MLIITLEYQSLNVEAKTNLSRQKVIIVDVVLYDFRDRYTSRIKQNLEDIQKQNDGNVRFNFYDSKGNQVIQDEIINKISTSTQDALLVNLVDIGATQSIIDQFKQRGVPVIFLNKDSIAVKSIKSNKKEHNLGGNENEENILVDLWNNNRTAIDTNNNGVLQYIILRDSQESISTQERMESVISTLEGAGIQTTELVQCIANWNRELAKENVNILFLIYGSNIETIITSDDEAARGNVINLSLNKLEKPIINIQKIRF